MNSKLKIAYVCRDGNYELCYTQWTKGLSAKESRMNIFNQIRNIPIKISPRLFSFEDGPKEMLIYNRGFCVPKHYLMGHMYKKLGIPVRYYTSSFKWNDTKAGYPAALKKRAEELPVAYHLACQILVNNKWITVDSTWPPALKKNGFPVNEEWDGETNTILAVNPLENFFHEDAKERENVFKEKMSCYTMKEKLNLSRFTHEFNKWVGELAG